MAVPAASARRTAKSAGTRAAGSGGWAETRRASATLPSSRAVTMRASQPSRSAVTRVCSESRSVVTISRPSSSRLTVEADATTERTSRNGASLPALRAATARSFQPARFMRGSSSSAMVSRGSGETSWRPSARARAFCSSMALRTAGMPPRSSCSATGSSSGRNSASAALRCVETGWSRRGRSGRSERTGRDPAAARSRDPGTARSRDPGTARSSRPGRSARPARPGPAVAPSRDGRPSRPGRARPAPGALSVPGAPLSPLRRGGAPRPDAPRRGRSPRPSSSRRRLPGTRTTDTPPGPLSRPDPTISMRAAFSTLAPSLGASTEVTTMPSRSNSASARSTSPTLAPSGRRVPSSDPRGWRAPGARHVHVPSSRLLVSSMSILRVIGVGPRYRRHRHGENLSLVPVPTPSVLCFCGGSENTGETRPDTMCVP